MSSCGQVNHSSPVCAGRELGHHLPADGLTSISIKRLKHQTFFASFLWLLMISDVLQIRRYRIMNNDISQNTTTLLAMNIKTCLTVQSCNMSVMAFQITNATGLNVMISSWKDTINYIHIVPNRCMYNCFKETYLHFVTCS